MSFSRQHLLSTLAPAVWHVLSGMWCLDIRAYAYQLIAWSVCVQTCCILVASSVASSILLHTSSTPPDLLHTRCICHTCCILASVERCKTRDAPQGAYAKHDASLGAYAKDRVAYSLTPYARCSHYAPHAPCTTRITARM